jgi:UDPglucose--hexose-1-phosphate uridylyltransferase
MAPIRFESTESTLTVRNPLRGFAAEEQRIEVRRDPILGGTSVLNPFLASKAGFFGENDRAFIARLAEESAAGCVFCGEGLQRRTAMYPDELVPGGRLSLGEATLLPNLFALGAYHPLVVLSRAHFLELDGFTPALLGDGLALTREFLRCVSRRDQSAPYACVGANYLLPAGASIVHPHLQMLVTPLPYTRHARLLEACRSHHERHRSSCLDDLAREEERLGPRFIGRRGPWRWVAAFAPQGCNEILAVHEREQDFGALADEDVGDLAAGIASVLAAYGRLGLLCFNYALFSVRGDVAAPGFRCLFRIVSRQNLSPAYRNDDYYLQKLLDSDVVVTPPEELARRTREAW